MTERAYTVSEIDALRTAITYKHETGRYDGQSSEFYGEPYFGQIEEQIRTYMVAGITAADLIASETANPAEGGDDV